MFLGWGHTGPIRLWSSKSRPQQKLPTALAHSFASPYIRCGAGERWDPSQPGNFGRPLGQSEAPSESGGTPRTPLPPLTTTPITPPTSVHAHAYTAVHTRVVPKRDWERWGGWEGDAGVGGMGVYFGWGGGGGGVCFFRGVAHPEVFWGLGGDRRCGTWRFWGPRCHATPGAALRRGGGQGAANTRSHLRPPNPTVHPHTRDTPTPTSHPSPHPHEDPRAAGPTPPPPPPSAKATSTSHPAHPDPRTPPNRHQEPLAIFPPPPLFLSIFSFFPFLFFNPLPPVPLPSPPPWHASTALSTFEGATLVGKSQSSLTIIHNLPCNFGEGVITRQKNRRIYQGRELGDGGGGGGGEEEPCEGNVALGKGSPPLLRGDFFKVKRWVMGFA